MAFTLVVLSGGCAREAARPGWQGYVEGEFVQVASPLGGRVEQLAVARGQQVGLGEPLFVLERDAEIAAVHEAEARLAVAHARLEDQRKGLRPTELASIDAQLAQARTAAEISAREFQRQQELFSQQAIAASALDAARLARERDERAVEELAARRETARLGGRADAIAAAEAEVTAARAALERARWAVRQKAPVAPAAAFVHDTLFEPGEYAPPGVPVVTLLPPAGRKVRFFVPENDFARLRPGQPVEVFTSSDPSPRRGRIDYLSPQPEYTPPVLYNRDNRAKLVFRVEAAFADSGPALPPGLPVDVVPVPPDA